jgi:hypothetical protein
MKAFKLQRMRAASVVLFVLPILFAGFSAGAQESATATQPAGNFSFQDLALYPQLSWHAAAPGAASAAAKADSGPEAEAKPQKSGIEGVQIHGHWVIDVKNPDGKVAEHREFDNSLVTSSSTLLYSTGDQLLAGLLAGSFSVSRPAIAFIGTPTGAIPASPGIPAFCMTEINNLTCDVFYAGTDSFFSILKSPLNDVQSGSPYAATETPGLLTSASFNSGAVNWVLSGNFIAPAARTIGAVETRAVLCAVVQGAGIDGNGIAYIFGTDPGHSSTLASGSCSLSNVNKAPLFDYPTAIALTYTVINNGGTPAPIKVIAGQGIFVTVTITFS